MNKVLIIEDNEQNRYLFAFLLKDKGYAVFEAVDGRSGIEMAREIQPDLILLDIQLPDIDGYQVARTLRTHGDLAATPIVAVTSYAMTGDRQKTLAAGCSGYIEKPINPQTFMQELKAFLSTPNKENGQ